MRKLAQTGSRRIRHPRPQPSARSGGYLLLPVVLVIAVVAAVAFLMNRESTIDIRAAGAAAEGDAARYIAEAGLRHALWTANTGACSSYGLPKTSFSGQSYEVVFTPDNGSPVSVTATGTLASGATRTLRRDGVRIHQASSGITVEPDTAAGKDTRLYEWKPNWNYGESTNLQVEGWSNSRSHSLIRFDLSGIPPGAQITGALLELYQNSLSSWGGTVSVHRITRDWVEGNANGGSGNGATWNESEPGVPWTTPGGDVDPAAFAVTTIPVGVQGWFQWDVTALVNGWHSSVDPNYGLLLKPGDDSTGVYFSSSDDVASELPRLIVTYACECGVVCLPPPPACDADFSPNTSVAEFSTAGQSYRYNRGITYFPQGQSINGTPAPAGGGWIAVGESDRLVLLDLGGNILDDGFGIGVNDLKGISFVSSGAKADHLAVVTQNVLYFVDPTILPAGSSFTVHPLPFAANAQGISYVDGGSYDRHLAIVDSDDRVIYIVDQSLNLVTTLFTDSILDKPEGIAHLKNTDKFLVVEKDLDTALIVHSDLTVSQNYDLTQFGYVDASGAAIHPVSCNHVIGDHPNDRYKSLNVGGGPIDVRVASSSDDAEELNFNNSVDLASSDLELVEDIGFSQTVGMRFANITVPNGATITSAWIQFKTDETSTGGINLTIQGEAVDDAPTFVDSSGNISSRALTTASVSWSPGPWNAVGEVGPKQQTPDFSSVIQEIVDRPGWTPGNAMVVIISGSGRRTAESFDGDAAGAPLLHIEY